MRSAQIDLKVHLSHQGLTHYPGEQLFRSRMVLVLMF
uniref:Uncharacterized protein n=1 Tax=Parascaris equorum TaxID=6256 RepID=A0A914S3P2_PAREQ